MIEGKVYREELDQRSVIKYAYANLFHLNILHLLSNILYYELFYLFYIIYLVTVKGKMAP